MERRYCDGKIIYDKKGAITARNARSGQDHVELRIYPHEKCGGWHLTKRDPNGGRFGWKPKKKKKLKEYKRTQFRFR